MFAQIHCALEKRLKSGGVQSDKNWEDNNTRERALATDCYLINSDAQQRNTKASEK